MALIIPNIRVGITARAFYLTVIALFDYAGLCAQKHYSLSSPDKKITVDIAVGSNIQFSIYADGRLLVQPSTIGLETTSGNIRTVNQVHHTRSGEVSVIIESPVPEKRKYIPDHYRELTLFFRRPVNLTFRAYNDGVAYRWEGRFTDSIRIRNEIAEYRFNDMDSAWYSPVNKREDADSFHTSFEEPYQFRSVSGISDSVLFFTPALIQAYDGKKLLLTESDLEDYPGMFFRGSGSTVLRGSFAPYPLEETIKGGEFRQSVVTGRADYIAQTTGKRNFPWRVFIISREDRELPGNDLVYRLGSPSRLNDVSWIRPGQATDEWIIGINLFNIPFRAGINTETYKYYIDFASRFGLERILMDAGWSDYNDLFKIHPGLDMDTLAAYARQKGVGLSLWTLAMTLDRQLDSALLQFKKWGVDFIMTDFMDRDDQKMVNFYHRVAAACAREKIMVMFHGAFKPAGFTRTWPNAVTREGVLGSEYNIWSDKATPAHNVCLPFIRMVAGPMDYEPGLLDNATPETFRPIPGKPMSMGTRTNQLAMFLVYDSPIQIFSGNPSQGFLEPGFMELLGSFPTTWDQTLILDGKVGEFIITARKKGEDWFIGGMTGASGKEINISLNFLDNSEYEISGCEDGINASRYASDYKLKQLTVMGGDRLQITMAPGGGYAARLRKINK